MYSVDGLDRIRSLSDVPQADAGAPQPIVFGNEQRLLLAYVCSEESEGPPPYDSVQIMTSSSKGKIALVEFRLTCIYMFGAPNDESFAGHPLALRGLEPYGAFEIEDSSWIRQLERMNSVHGRHNSSRYARLRHYVFSFHDSTFECVAESFAADLREGSLRDVMAEMVQRVQGP